MGVGRVRFLLSSDNVQQNTGSSVGVGVGGEASTNARHLLLIGIQLSH